MAPSRSADLLPKSRKIVWTLTWAALATSSRWISARKWVFKSAVVSLRIRWRVAAAEVARARMVYILRDFMLITIHAKSPGVKGVDDLSHAGVSEEKGQVGEKCFTRPMPLIPREPGA